MLRINVEEVVTNLEELLELVAKGEEVILLEKNKVVARLVPPHSREQFLADLRKFRSCIPVKGEPLSTTIINAREEERY